MRLFSVDAPVSGGDIGARDGTLSIMIGGDRETVNRLNPLFEAMGKNIRHMGEAGAGQHTKMSNQILVANNMVTRELLRRDLDRCAFPYSVIFSVVRTYCRFRVKRARKQG